MKKLLCLLLLITVLCAAAAGGIASSDSLTWYGTMMVDHCEEWVSLRSAPDTASRRLAKVPLFALVTDARWQPAWGDFIFCVYGDLEGYILSRYLEPWSDPEPEEAVYASPLGFSFTYDPSVMSVDEESSEDGQSLLVSVDTGDDPVYLEIFTREHIAMSPLSFLVLNAPEGTSLSEDVTEAGWSLRSFRKAYEHNPDLVQAWYGVEKGDAGVAGIALWPASAGEQWADAFLTLMRSVRLNDSLNESLNESLPLQAAWGTSSPGAVVVDEEEGAFVTLSSAETLTDVQLLSLELSFEGDAVYQAAPLRALESISPDRPLTLKLAFPGDIPSYGIRVTDGKGQVRQFALLLSGLDGSLFLEEF